MWCWNIHCREHSAALQKREYGNIGQIAEATSIYVREYPRRTDLVFGTLKSTDFRHLSRFRGRSKCLSIAISADLHFILKNSYKKSCRFLKSFSFC